MKLMKHVKKIVAIGMICVFSLGLFAGCTPKETTYTQEQLDAQLEIAEDASYNDGVNSVDITVNDNEVISFAVIDAVNKSEAEMQKDIDRLSMVIEDINAVALEVEAKAELEAQAVAESYLKDELMLDVAYTFSLRNRKASSLFDDEITFDGEDYDADEVLEFSDIKLAINDEDFNDDVYLQIPEDGFVYKFVIEDTLNKSEICDDETLELNFLGEGVEISEWDDDSIEFTKGIKQTVIEGESLEVDGKTVTASIIHGDYVYVTVTDGDEAESKKVEEGSTREILGLEVYVESVMDNEALEKTQDMATLKVGKEVKVEINDGDEYDADDRFEWIIDGHSIGLVLVEDYTDLDEDYQPLAAGEKLCLPNEYVCIEYNGLEDEEYLSYDFEYDTDDGYVRALGDFLLDLKDYDEILIDGVRILDEDEYQVATGTITMGDSNLVLTANADGSIQFENIKLLPKVLGVEVDGTDISGKDDDYRSEYGSIVYNPEDGVEDQELTVDIPEEEVEGSLNIG